MFETSFKKILFYQNQFETLSCLRIQISAHWKKLMILENVLFLYLGTFAELALMFSNALDLWKQHGWQGREASVIGEKNNICRRRA